jgi:acyl-CoA synthetase (AMP-forming)/AMP-acid ligase II
VKLASQLIHKGTRPGDRVIVALHNQVEWCIAFWATAYLECQFVPLDPRSLVRGSDAAHFIRTIRPHVVLVATSQIAAAVDEALELVPRPPPIRLLVESTGKLEHPWDSMATLLAQAPQQATQIPCSPQAAGVEDTAIIFFTSGTGALPKACPLNTVNITAPAYATAMSLGMRPGHHLCQHLPGFHIFSVVMTLAAWLQGAAVVFPSPAFDPGASIRTMEVTSDLHVPCVPTMVQAIADHMRASQSFPSLTSMLLGGTVISKHDLDLAKAVGPKRLAVGYGMSEGVLTLLNVQHGRTAAPQSKGQVSVGVAISGARIKICRQGTRVAIRRGDIGELHQGGLPVFGGYLDQLEDSCYKEEDVNFIATGDQAFMDDKGHVYILGRYKDVIIRGGENISPARIEHHLADTYGLLVSGYAGTHAVDRY